MALISVDFVGEKKTLMKVLYKFQVVRSMANIVNLLCCDVACRSLTRFFYVQRYQPQKPVFGHFVPYITIFLLYITM